MNKRVFFNTLAADIKEFSAPQRVAAWQDALTQADRLVSEARRDYDQCKAFQAQCRAALEAAQAEVRGQGDLFDPNLHQP